MTHSVYRFRENCRSAARFEDVRDFADLQICRCNGFCRSADVRDFADLQIMCKDYCRSGQDFR